MRIRSTPAALLLRVARAGEREEQAASFRQALTALAQACELMGPPPLDGVDPRALEGAAHLAVERGFADDLDWIGHGAAAVALYELSSALPPGPIKRDLRRRVFSLLYEGNAAAFLPVAIRISMTNPAPLATPTLRARVALCLELPPGASVNAGPLALSLITRTNSHASWVSEASTQGLPARRLASLLYEHAAREALFRFQLGDHQARDQLLTPTTQFGLLRLLRDREPLVWRHAAIARGLLGTIDTPTRSTIEQELDPQLGVSEWRRAAVSLVASLVAGKDEIHRSVVSLLRGPIAERDPGFVAPLVGVLPRVSEFEPELARDLMRRLAAFGRSDVAVALAETLRACRDPSFAVDSIGPLRDLLLTQVRRQSTVERAIWGRAVATLSADGNVDADLPASVDRALLSFEAATARDAFDRAAGVVAEAEQIVTFIEGGDLDDAVSSAALLSGLVELDAGVFERPVLPNLLLLGRRPGDPDGVVEPIERIKSRVSRWIVDGLANGGGQDWSRETVSFDQRRLRTLLHLVDADAGDNREGERPIRRRLVRAIHVLLGRLTGGPDVAVHRVLCAALARCFDAAVREDAVLPGDLVLLSFASLSDHYSVQALAEASTAPDIARPLEALARFVSPDGFELSEGLWDSGLKADPSSADDPEDARALALAGKVLALGQTLTGGGDYHAEALRRVFFRLGRCLEAIALAESHAELLEARGGESHPLTELMHAVEDLAFMIRNAELRVLGASTRSPSSNFESSDLQAVLVRGLDSGEMPSHDEVGFAIETLVRPLPETMAHVVEEILFRLHRLPLVAPSSKSGQVQLLARRAPLPDWLLPRRAIGSFYVLRSLGGGGASSVFLARRMEERDNPKAEAFALKVPAYDPATARSMSEQEFFELFKEEAGALLSLPAHPNLARFVTFDLAARPKPILVMELIQGVGLDRLLRSRSLTLAKVAHYLDSLLAGLEAMHAAGLGHLDVKPSNVILRGGKEPVLVDFGLSGRKLRPGCGTIEYTAPEVLGVAPSDYESTPPAADIYAFGALMYELLTGRLLFDAPDEVALVTRHVSHDGWMDALVELDRVPGASNAARVMGSCLRRDPRKRPAATLLRAQVERALKPLLDESWPLPTHSETKAEARLG